MARTGQPVGEQSEAGLPAAPRCLLLASPAGSETPPHAFTSFMLNYCTARVARTVLTSSMAAMPSKGRGEMPCVPHFSCKAWREALFLLFIKLLDFQIGNVA